MPTLNWIGKDKVVTHHNDVPYRVLDRKYTFGDTPDSGNKIIHGDNLEALKALLPEYEGKIKCIYIDPPYNTGNEDWVYNDNVNDPRIRKWLGQVVGSEVDDLTRHDKWLCMMYPRLVLLQKLLSEDGVMFISIDEHEIENLISICNEIFGKKNVESIVWQKQDSKVDRNTNAKVINRYKSIHENIVVCYADKNATYFNKMMKLPDWKGAQKNVDNDPRGNWQSGIISFEEGHAKEDRFSPFYYTIKSPSGVEWTRHWFFLKEEMDVLISENRVYFGKAPDFSNVPRLKTFENEEKEYYMDSIMRGVGTSSTAKDEIESILGNRDLFDTPKPTKLIMELVRCAAEKNSIVLDSFAGSGTTAHAVLCLNNQDGGNRKFILCEMCDYAESITAERVRRVMSGYGEGKNAVEGTGGSFDFYELGETIFDPVSGSLNDNADTEQIRRYVWFSETNSAYVAPSEDAHPFLLGSYQHNNYYFFYIKGEETCLDWDFLNTFTERDRAEMYVIYADRCVLTEEEMLKINVRFKKIPRDIKRL